MEQTPNNGTKSEQCAGKVKYQSEDCAPMIVTIKTSKGEKRVRLPAGASAADALGNIKLARTHHIVMREGRPIPSDEPLRNLDVLDVVEVFSGG